ncbi:MAG: protein SCO1/2 [Flavobacteriales bacterium]|jgi:protein SCO1/2
MKNNWVLLLFAFMLSACVSDEDAKVSFTPPYYGPHDVVQVEENGVSRFDTTHYTIPKFSFTNQKNEEVSHKNYAGHIYIADFFFSNCPSICPILSSQLARIQDKLIQDSLLGTIMILSHTVDPRRDSVEALNIYAERLGAKLPYWNFVTGDPGDLYYQAEQGYLVTAFESDTAAGGFFHTDQFALIDEKMRIRGYYDGTSTSEVDSMYTDILRLINLKND